MNKKAYINDISSTTALNILGRGIGFLIPFFIAAWFFLGVKTDIVFFLYGVILYLTSIFTASLQSNIVPFLSNIIKEKPRVDELASRLLSFAFVASVIFSVFFIIISKPLFRLLTKFPEDSYGFLFTVSVEASPLIILIVLSSILGGVLNAFYKFWLPPLCHGLRALVCIITMFIFKNKLGIHSVILGYILGEIFRILIYAAYILKNNIISFKFNITADAKLITFFRTLSFQVISLTAIGMNPVVDKIMGSWLGEGSVSLLYYADRLYHIPIALFSYGFMVVILSRWSREYHDSGDINVLRKNLHVSMLIVFMTAGLFVFFMYLLSNDIVRIAYARGKFPAGLIQQLRSIFVFYLIGIPFYLMGQTAVRAHLVLHKTKILMYSAIMQNFFNIIFNLILMRSMGLKGIALSTSVTSVIACVYLYGVFYFYSRKERSYNAGTSF